MKKDGDEFKISFVLVKGFYYRYAYVDMKNSPNRAFIDSS
jgi:hypothetical protein